MAKVVMSLVLIILNGSLYLSLFFNERFKNLKYLKFALAGLLTTAGIFMILYNDPDFHRVVSPFMVFTIYLFIWILSMFFNAVLSNARGNPVFKIGRFVMKYILLPILTLYFTVAQILQLYGVW